MKVLLVTTLSVMACLPATAQDGGPPHARGQERHFGVGHQPVVTGAPYSATVTNSVVEHLDGGNTIQHSSTGQVARDSQGRTFEQMSVHAGRSDPETAQTLIFLSDPVAGYSYVLNPAEKTAMRRPLHIANRANAPNAGQHLHTEGEEGGAAVAQLGQDTSTGVVAEGQSFTHTIPAGKIGNSQPITSTVQRWYSAELQLVVKSVRSDPRFGQKTYMLSNIVRTEPDASLFQIPAGYKVVDAPAHGFVRGGSHQQ